MGLAPPVAGSAIEKALIGLEGMTADEVRNHRHERFLEIGRRL